MCAYYQPSTLTFYPNRKIQQWLINFMSTFKVNQHLFFQEHWVAKLKLQYIIHNIQYKYKDYLIIIKYLNNYKKLNV